MSKKRFLTGVLIGATAGVLLAPKPGSETRAELAEKIKVFLDKLKQEMSAIEDFDEIGFSLEDKIIDLKNELVSLDKEKVKKIAQKQAENIKNRAEDLYEMAKAKGTPILQKAADDICEKSAELLYNMADNLEATKKKPIKKINK